MEIKKSGNMDMVTFTLIGKFTFSDHRAFRVIIESMKVGESKNYTLDLSRLEFVDSAALGMFLVARDEARKHNIKITLKGAYGHVLKMFQMSNFSSLFTLA